MMCLDGNFGLVRKQTSGKDVNPPRMGTLYFLEQCKVDEFVKESDKEKKVVVCIHMFTYFHMYNI